MAWDLFWRFMIGGAIVSAFSLLGGLFKPRTFAGLFGAAPSVALATLALTFRKEGASYAAIEGRSMIIGAVALSLYCLLVWLLIRKLRLKVPLAASAGLMMWFGVAAAGYFAVLS